MLVQTVIPKLALKLSMNAFCTSLIASPATPQRWIFVAIDVAKLVHDALVELPTGHWQRWRITNCWPDHEALRDRLRALETPVLIRFEATGNYHRWPIILANAASSCAWFRR